MSIRSSIAKFGAFIIFILLCGVGFSVLSQQPAHAAGEVFTWAGPDTISVSGGDLKGTSVMRKVPTNLVGEQTAKFSGTLLYNKGGNAGCTIGLDIYLYKSSGTSAGTLWNPPPYDAVVATPTGGPGTCWEAGIQDIDPSMHNRSVPIGGNPSGGPVETPDQRLVRVTIYPSEPMSTAPKQVTITLKKGDGTTVGSQTVPAKDEVSSQSTLPPEQRAVSYSAIFQNIDPGDYQVCDTYTNKCQPVKHKDAGKPLDFTYGTKFQADYTKEIRVHVIVHGSRPCGSTITINPQEVIVTGSDGKEHKVQTSSAVGNPQPEEIGRSCTAQYAVTLEAVLKDMPAGHYEACTTGAECVGGDKKDGEPLELELNVITEQDAPPDQPICISGDGIAGALAWIACPAVELIAKASDLFEKSIIIPFMTISPLTTNNSNAVYVLWQNLRDLANVGFVVLAMYSVISISLSKYNMKRALPRLLIVAIGINLSYFIVAFVVDAFNIFGAGISQLLMSALQQAGTAMPVTGTKSSPASVFALGGAALLTVIVTAGSAIGWLFGIIGLAFLFILVMIIVLVIRQVAIVTLVIVAPVAVLMYLLPNTEHFFTRWRRTLVQLLMMYPLMVLLFAAGKLFGAVIMQPDFKIGAVQGFAALFQIPYDFLAQATGTITDQAVQGIKILLWFSANALAPGLGLPIVLAASGTIMDKSFGALSNRFLKPRVQNAKSDLSTMGAELRGRAMKYPGLHRIAGRKARRDATRSARETNLRKSEEEYAAQSMANSGLMRLRAAGVAGKAGRTRAAAGAAGVAARSTKEDIDNEMALLHDKMHEIAIDEETMSDRIAEYLENPTDANAIVTGTNGKTFNLATEGKGLQRAMLNSAASQGHVSAIEAARLNSNIKQSTVDDIIRRNEGELKKHGGNHLVTQFNMAAGRDFDMSTAAGRNKARVKMHTERLSTMANSGQNSIAGMKYGLLTGTADMLDQPNFKGTPAEIQAQVDHRNDVLAAMSAKDKAQLYDKLDTLLKPSNSSTLARADVDPDVFRTIRDNM